MSFDTDLVTGFAILLAADIDSLAFQPDGTKYADVATGIFLFRVPASPDRIVSLATYGLGDDSTYGDSSRGLQIRTRGAGQDPRDALDLQTLIGDVLVGRFPIDLATGVHVQTLVRTSGPTSLGQDDNKRWEFASNYSLGLHEPGTHRL